jgi:hypothetical protein
MQRLEREKARVIKKYLGKSPGRYYRGKKIQDAVDAHGNFVPVDKRIENKVFYTVDERHIYKNLPRMHRSLILWRA